MKSRLFSITSLCTIFLLSLLSINAQVSNYTFSQTTSVYGSVNSGSVIGTIQQNDDINAVALPFPFVYNNSTYTTINVCSNGYLSFNTVSSNAFSPIADNSTSELISPFGQDLFMGTVIFGDLTAGSNTISNVSSTVGLTVGDEFFDYGLDFGGISPTITAIFGTSIVVNINSTNSQQTYDLILLNGSIRTNITGVAPNRVFEIQYNNFCTVTSIYNEIVNFKVRLFETSNKIEFLYGFMSPGLLMGSSQVGLKGNSILDFNARKVSSNDVWSSSTAASLNTDVCVFSNTLFPVSGLSYLWSPPTCVTPTLSVSQNPAYLCPGMSVTLTASGAGTYTWNTGSTSNSLVVSPNTTTNYAVSAGSLTCITTKTLAVNVANCTDIANNVYLEDQLRVYPNPFEETLNFNITDKQLVTIFIHDPLGNLIVEKEFIENTETSINTSSFLPGLYTITIKSGDTILKQKLCKP